MHKKCVWGENFQSCKCIKATVCGFKMVYFKREREREDGKVITQYCTWNVEWMESKINITVTFESFLHCSPPLFHLTCCFWWFLPASYWGVVHTANKLDRRWTLNVKCHKFPPIPYMQTFIIFHVIIITTHNSPMLSHALSISPPYERKRSMRSTMNFKGRKK